MHRKLGPRDLYAIYNAAQGTVCKFRATGKVELWDPWTGETRLLPLISQKDGVTELALPLAEKEIQLVVFSPGKAESAPAPRPELAQVEVGGDWEFELQPMLDNRFGDFHWPPTPTRIGAEARQVEYSEATNGPWKRVTSSFGPQFLKFGPVAKPADEASLTPDGRWKPYEFSWRWGVEGDSGHQGYHGLKEEVHDEFIALGRLKLTATGSSYEKEGESSYYLWTTVRAPRAMTAYSQTGELKPAKVWLNGALVNGNTLELKAGPNPLLLRYDKPGRTFFVVSTQAAPAGAEAFSPAACWIWYPREKTTATRWFRKTFDLDQAPAQAPLRITCCNAYEISINGKILGSGDHWDRVQEYDIAKALRPGRNEILVRARNDAAAAGLIAELVLGTKRIVTDSSWQSAKTETGELVPVETVGTFTNSLWYSHPMGPPKLEPRMANGQPQFKLSPLAMTWWTNTAVLPFDIRPQEQSLVGWYRFTAPPGLRAMKMSVRGQAQAWVNGQEAAVQNDEIVVANPSPSPVPVVLRIQQEPGYYGGAALLEPIRLECGPGRITLGNWSKIDGLLSYSGGAWYRKTITLPSAKQVLLDLGNVAASAEVRVNGQPAGIRVSPPWRFDITRLAKAGENRIEVFVCNTLANHYTTIPTRYRGATTSGLLGPVTLHL